MSTQETFFPGEPNFTIDRSRRQGPHIFTEKILRGLPVGPGDVFPILCGPVTQRGPLLGVGVQPIQILSAHHGPALGGSTLEQGKILPKIGGRGVARLHVESRMNVMR